MEWQYDESRINMSESPGNGTVLRQVVEVLVKIDDQYAIDLHGACVLFGADDPSDFNMRALAAILSLASQLPVSGVIAPPSDDTSCN